MKKQGEKGGEIKYNGIQMASYLQPFCSALTISEKQEIFSIKNGMINIPSNYGTKNEFMCGKIKNSAHFYECQKLNKELPRIEYDQIYSENIGRIKVIYERFQKNIKEREKRMNEPIENENFHETNGPLFSVVDMVNSNG